MNVKGEVCFVILLARLDLHDARVAVRLPVTRAHEVKVPRARSQTVVRRFLLCNVERVHVYAQRVLVS